MAGGDELFDPSVSLDTPLPQLVASLKWYHTFDLPGGVTTPGYYDLRRVAPHVPIPNDLSGKRCLDAASADGFFAFEMARRGGEVVSVDLESAAGQDYQGVTGPRPGEETTGARERFEITKWATGLEVERHDMNLYDVSVDALGTFDFVFMGNVLLHLADPGRVLRNVRSVTRGQFLSFETVSLPLTVLRPFAPSATLSPFDEPRWWTPNKAAHERLLVGSGFKIDSRTFPLLQPFGSGLKARTPRLRRAGPGPLGQHLALILWTRYLGATSQALLAS